MKHILILLAITALHFTPVNTDLTPVDRYIYSITSHAPQTRKRALKLTETINQTAEKYNEDPLLIAYIIFKESSFRSSVIGRARGEIGLMQVHGKAAKGCDLETAEGQIDCGTKWIGQCRSACDGSDLQTFNVYAVGYCTPITSIAKKRNRQYQRIRRLFGE